MRGGPGLVAGETVVAKMLNSEYTPGHSIGYQIITMTIS